jgi:UDP-N-acetylglucosamine 2-epimerase (non-hydrolysing)
MIRLLFWVGTRPEAIKLAPLIVLAARDSRFEVRIATSGQHELLAGEALRDFGISPDIQFPQSDFQGLPENLALYIGRASTAISSREFDFVIVHGDTSSTLAGALAGFLLKVPVVHVEAGLRSFDLKQPFPEEANRSLVARVASLNLAPTEISAQNLLSEGVAPKTIAVVGNSIVDAVRIKLGALGHLKLGSKEVVVTAHRRENWDQLGELCQAVKILSQEFSDFQFLLPLHPNPIVRGAFQSLVGVSNVSIVDPMPYSEFLSLLSRSQLVITDSGGIQEELVSLRVPCLIVRGSTERPEVLSTGFIDLVDLNADSIVSAASQILKSGYEAREGVNPLGDGFTSERILDLLASAQA